MRLNISFNVSRKAVLIFITLIAVSGSLVIVNKALSAKNPLPADIKEHVKYQVIYPAKTDQIEQTSFQYHTDEKTLIFNVKTADKTIVFTQQPAPGDLGDDTQAYYPALGLHPYGQFQTKLGTVALVKFWESGDLKPAGQSAILASNGTLLIATSQKGLSNAEWKTLFESLKVTP